MAFYNLTQLNLLCIRNIFKSLSQLIAIHYDYCQKNIFKTSIRIRFFFFF